MIYLAFHGVLILTVSLVSGGWFAKAIITKGNEVAWRVVHSGGSMGGIMLIAFSSLVPVMVLPQWAETLFVWSIILSAWLFIIAMIVAAITGERGLKTGGSLINRGVYYFYIFGSLFSLVGCGLLLKGLYSAL
ncbi:MAG: hypothetical protein KAJ39_08690 [Gammaproteobacteria bacterium]|nr:hypothetical protein [Gammaproteobacteria bacterium]